MNDVDDGVTDGGNDGADRPRGGWDPTSPDPATRWRGRIGRTLSESDPFFPEPHGPTPGSPNVVVVLLDDTGFAQFGCYGSDIDTANLDRLAADGLQFTNFHVTPLCSPTRAALLTGRSHHAVGMRGLSNFQTGFPHQRGHIANEAATIAEVLHDEGYATFGVGKWHLAPMEQCSAAGPFDQWPLARGFDRFYGFLEGETDQFHPDLVCDNHHVDPPATPDDGYHLSEDLVDQLLAMLADSTSVRPDRPFFAYLAFGATHAPHQAPERYLEKYRGRFDEGWDVHRRRSYERQLEMGVIPAGTELSPRNPGVDAWEDLPPVQQRLAARLQEAFAAFLDHTDDQIGRLVAGLEALGQLDDTILVVMSDNGASQEGGPFGVMHEMKFFNGILETPDEAIERIDEIGGPHSHTNYPWGWAQCGNTPFRWYKGNTHEGGVHVPMIVHWPAGLGDDDAGTMRDQFMHVSDVAPTIYELLGITPPATLRGVDQLPVTGRSFATAIRDADAPATNDLQYFEMFGSRAVVSDGWKAVCRHLQGVDYDTEEWELYDLTADRSETKDLADDHPERLAEMIDLWWSEAERNGVLPLDDRILELFGVRFRDGSPHPADHRYHYVPPMSPMLMSPMPAQASAAIGGRNFDLLADVTTTADDAGVLYSTGTANSGMSLFVQDGRLVLDYNAFGDHTIIESDQPVPVGRATLGLSARRGEGRTAEMSLTVDGRVVGSVAIALYLTIMSSVGASVGYDHGSPVSERYDDENPFTGTLHAIDIHVLPHDSATAVHREVITAESRAAMSRQ